MQVLKEKKISHMDFSELVGLVNEPNTPSGAHESIRQICINIPMARIQTILDVGSNTGFATIEIASLTNAHVTGLDVNPQSIAFAQAAAEKKGLRNAKFDVGNILDLPYDEASFDMVYCNNVTSFIKDRGSAIDQYRRVLKPGGFLAAVPIYYRKQPPEELVEKVSKAISAPIDVRGIEQWQQAFQFPDMQPYYQAHFAYDDLSSERIEEYTKLVINNQRLPKFSMQDINIARERMLYFYKLFNENLRYCGFSVMVFRVSSPNDFPVLHTSHQFAKT